jgi:dTDP-glucose 4,6-dehydratase
MKVATNGIINQKYNIGGDNLLSNKKLVKVICNILVNKFNFKKNIFNLINYVKDRPGHDLKYSQNSSKIKKIGWKSKYNIYQALEKTISWYLKLNA